jgi:hypothetical protein
MGEFPTVQTWTHDEIKGQFPAVSNLKDVVGNIEDLLWNKGHVVCEVRVNGMFFSEDDEQKFAGTPVADINTLEVKSRSQRDLIMDTLGSFYELLPKLNKICLEASALIRRPQTPDVNVKIREILDATCWLTDALKLLKFSVLELVNDSAFEDGWNENEKQYSHVIAEMLKAFEINDWVLLADVLEYDLTTACENWLELLRGQDTLTP